jgi:hypothetical protein
MHIYERENSKILLYGRTVNYCFQKSCIRLAMEGRAMVKAVLDQAAKCAPGQEIVTPLSAIRKRAAKVSNLWIFDSPKNNRRLTVAGDVPFLHLILLEGDPSVAGYDLVDDPFSVMAPSDTGYVRVRGRDGGQYWLVVKRQGARRRKQQAEATFPSALLEKATLAGVQLHARSELELAGKEVLLDNWLTLCAIMTRARSYASYQESEQLLGVLARHSSIYVKDVLALRGVDPGIMLAVVAKALQSGVVRADLTRQLFGPHTQLDRVRS